MIAELKTWLARKRTESRFRKHFVEPYAARIEAGRRRHGAGVRAIEAERRAKLHEALAHGPVA